MTLATVPGKNESSSMSSPGSEFELPRPCSPTTRKRCWRLLANTPRSPFTFRNAEEAKLSLFGGLALAQRLEHRGPDHETAGGQRAPGRRHHWPEHRAQLASTDLSGWPCWTRWSTSTAIDPSASKPDRGVVTLFMETLNQNDKVVQRATGKLLVFRRPAED